MWRPSLSHYRTSELSAVKFENDDELKKALELIWSDNKLFSLPRIAGPKGILIIPTEAISSFEELRFSVHEVIPNLKGGTYGS